MSYGDYVKKQASGERTHGVYRPSFAPSWMEQDTGDDSDDRGDWFEREYSHYNYDSGYSASSYFSRWGSAYSSKADIHEKASAALREAARSANVIRQRYGVGKEKALVVAWSDGKAKNNQRSSDAVIHLSPDIINSQTTAKPKWTDDQRNDALCGEAYFAAAFKRTLDVQALNQFKLMGQTKQKNIVERMWFSTESNNAMREVVAEYRGLAPYFKANIEYRSDETFKNTLQQTAIASAPNSKTAADLFAWNLLHPDDPISVPTGYQQALSIANAEMAKTKTSAERFDASRRVARKFLKMFNEPDEPQNPNGGKGSAAKDANGNDVNGHSKGDAGYSPEAIGSEDVGNGVDPNLSKDKVDCDDKNGGVDADTRVRTQCYDVLVNEVMQGVRAFDATQAYKALAKECQPYIMQLKHKLRFRAVKRSVYSMGMRGGEIDEGSLWKLGADKRDDRLFMKKEEVGHPEIAFTILIDESSSMTACSDTRDIKTQRYLQCRQLACTLVEALSAFQGVHIALLGHFSSGASFVRHYYTPDNYKRKEAVTQISATAGTDEGTAIYQATNHAVRWFGKKVERNIVVSLSDGGTNVDWTHKQCERAKKLGVQVYGIGVGKPYGNKEGCALYGVGRFAILPDVRQAINVLGSFITMVATK